jgi:hypothetical protein
MAFWRRSSEPAPNKDNPFRALDPDGFDKGARINDRTRQLQKVAADGLSQDEALTALSNALGNEVAAMVTRQRGLSVDEVLHWASNGVREQAHMALGNAFPQTVAQELTEQEFGELAARIVSTATTNTVTNDAVCATAKALGILITISAPVAGCSADELLKFSQEAIAKFAQEAATFMGQNPSADPSRRLSK